MIDLNERYIEQIEKYLDKHLIYKEDLAKKAGINVITLRRIEKEKRASKRVLKKLHNIWIYFDFTIHANNG